MDTNNLLLEKNILITGASSGIGKSLAINLSKFGANVIMLSKNEKALDSVYDEIKEKYNTEPMIIKCDLADLNEIKSQEITEHEICLLLESVECVKFTIMSMLILSSIWFALIVISLPFILRLCFVIRLNKCCHDSADTSTSR